MRHLTAAVVLTLLLAGSVQCANKGTSRKLLLNSQTAKPSAAGTNDKTEFANAWEFMTSYPGLATIAATVRATGLDSYFVDPTNEYTLFLPNDDAFRSFFNESGVSYQELINATDVDTYGLLLFHVQADLVLTVSDISDQVSPGFFLPLVEATGDELYAYMGQSGATDVLDTSGKLGRRRLLQSNTTLAANATSSSNSTAEDDDAYGYYYYDEESQQQEPKLLPRATAAADADAKPATAAAAAAPKRVLQLQDHLGRVATVVVQDIKVGAGVAHVIDKVLLPVHPLNVEQALAFHPQLSFFAAALQRADKNLTALVNRNAALWREEGEPAVSSVYKGNDTSLTLLAPTNKAFEALAKARGTTLPKLLASSSLLLDILSSHIIINNFSPISYMQLLGQTDVIPAANPNTVLQPEFDWDSGLLSLVSTTLAANSSAVAGQSTATVRLGDIVAGFSLIHVLDTVLGASSL